MWSAIRSDLKEFVSSVADDGTAVVTNIESKIIPERGDGGNDEYGSDDEEQVMIGDDGDVVSQMGFAQTGIVSNAQDEVSRREGLEETYTMPLLKGEVNGVKPTAKTEENNKDDETKVAGDDKGTEKSDEEDADESKEESEQVTTIGQTMDRMTSVESDDESNMSSEEIDHEPNQEKVIAFLEAFDLSAQTETISIILSEKTIVQEYFQTLVPVVLTYEQFWQRYFYRCNAMRIQSEWDELEAQKAEERRERVKKGVENVQKLWGGALNAVKGVTSNVTSGIEKTDKKESILSKYQAELEQLGAQGGSRNTNTDANERHDGGVKLGLGIFGGPRYADESDDEEIDNDEDSGEEYEDDELGWGSEEEDDDDEDHDDEISMDNSRNESEEITFATPSVITQEELDALRAELKQHEEDKILFQEKIDSQRKEIVQLQAGSPSNTTDKEEQERLQLILFEKDSELAALRASIEDSKQESNTDEETPDITGEIQRMNILLKNKEEELAETNRKLTKALTSQEESMASIETKMNTELESANETISKMQLEQAEAKASISKYMDEAMEWKKEVSSLKEKLASEHNGRIEAEAQLEKFNQSVKENDAKLEHLESEVQRLTRIISSKDDELIQEKLLAEETLKREINKVRQEQHSLQSPATEDVEGGSFSSGVDVAQTESEGNDREQVQTTKNDEDEEDGWGDSWESDED